MVSFESKLYKNNIIFLRHLKVRHNLEGIFLGQIDEDIIESSSLINNENIIKNCSTLIISSPAKRCISTTAILIKTLKDYQKFDYELEISEELIERNFGIFQGEKKFFIKRKFPEYFLNGKLDPFLTPPEGESFTSFFYRINNFYNYLIKIVINKYEQIIVISHQHVLKLLTCIICKLDIKLNWNKINYDNGILIGVSFYEK